jgi:cell wall-associated NlpC family hydrolase
MKSDGIIIKKVLLIIFAVAILTACGTVKRGSIPWEAEENTSVGKDSDSDSNSKSGSGEFVISEDAPADIKERQEFLQLAYNDWKGVPYVLGGLGYEGIDCSAFMQVVFEDYFSTLLPRTTLEQLSTGRSVKKQEITTGDMVFFKTGRKTYHVGVMVNEKEFLHASTSEGVKISPLDHPFWEETYLGIRRVF